MRNSRLSQRRLSALVLFAGLAATLGTGITQNVHAWKLGARDLSSRESSTTTPAKDKVNGKIVFASDRNFEDHGSRIWTMNADGSNPLLKTNLPPGAKPSSIIHDSRPKWSPDGTKIAFLSLGRSVSDDRSVYVMNADGSDLHQSVLDFPLGGELNSCEWSPDGTKFLCVADYLIGDIFGEGDGTITFVANIFTVAIDGKNATVFTHDTDLHNDFATWSPDGKLITFVSNREGAEKIFVMNADGSNRHSIVTASSDGVGDPSWSPDGSKILFVGHSNATGCYNVSCNELYTVNPDGSDLTQLTHYAGSYLRPRYSPDGTRILFWRYLETSYETQFGVRFYRDDGYAIFVMDADGRNQTKLSNRTSGTETEDFQPDWQPLSASASDPPPSVLGLSSNLYRAPSSGSPSVQITVNRSGNLNQAVSCQYQVQWNASVSSGLPHGAFDFAPGETSKTVDFSASVSSSDTVYFRLFDNGGNATFLGGIKDALISPANSGAIDNTDFFVRQQYKDFLNRDPDEAGWRFWNITLYTCGAPGPGTACYQSRRADVSAAFFLSTEFQQTGYLVYRTYKAAYGNLPGALVPNKFNEFLPDTQEIGRGVIVNEGNWQQQLEANKQAFFSEFVQRSRFVLAYPTWMTPAQFVDALFANADVLPTGFEREAAISEFNGVSSSADNAARARALRRVAENLTLAQQEFNRAFVLMQYFGYLRRNPNDAPDTDFSGYNFWLTKLNQFNGDFQKSEMVKAFISSSEYRQRFGP